MTTKKTEYGLTVTPKMFLEYLAAANIEKDDACLASDNLKVTVNQELADLILNKFKIHGDVGNFYDRKTDADFQDENLKFAYFKETKNGKETGRVLAVGFTVVNFGGTKEIEYSVSICCPEPCVKERGGEWKECKGDRFNRKIARKIISNRIKTGMYSHRAEFRPGVKLEQIVMQHIAADHPWDSARRLAKGWLAQPKQYKAEKVNVRGVF